MNLSRTTRTVPEFASGTLHNADILHISESITGVNTPVPCCQILLYPQSWIGSLSELQMTRMDSATLRQRIRFPDWVETVVRSTRGPSRLKGSRSDRNNLIQRRTTYPLPFIPIGSLVFCDVCFCSVSSVISVGDAVFSYFNSRDNGAQEEVCTRANRKRNTQLPHTMLIASWPELNRKIPRSLGVLT